MQRPCGPSQLHSLWPAHRETKNKGRGRDGDSKTEKRGGVKIKDGEKVREETSQSPCPGPQGTWQSVFVDTVPTGWQVPER